MQRERVLLPTKRFSITVRLDAKGRAWRAGVEAVHGERVCRAVRGTGLLFSYKYMGVGVRCCACALVLLCSLLRAREPSRCSISPLANLAQLASLSSGLLADASCALPTHSAHSSPLPHERTYATRASERFTEQSCKAVLNLYSEISL